MFYVCFVHNHFEDFVLLGLCMRRLGGGRQENQEGERGKRKQKERRERKERRNIMLAESGGDLKRKVAKTEKRERGKGHRKRKERQK